jgi:hypothetical protein
MLELGAVTQDLAPVMQASAAVMLDSVLAMVVLVEASATSQPLMASAVVNLPLWLPGRYDCTSLDLALRFFGTLMWSTF